LLAIVTLKHGEEAEASVSELSDVPLRGFDVEISLYRSDNLLCVTSLPSTLCSDDAAFKMFAETFGPVEKCFLMRASSGLCYQDFVEAYFMTVHSCLFLMCATDIYVFLSHVLGGSVAEWLAQKGNSLKQTVHTHCASVHQAAKSVAFLLRVAGVTAGLAESNGSVPPGL